ncbi:DinB family protein [Curvibacter sp. APW13]|uniref:DinB family protein n=1 Tax=Curvibacter sp. APW13 TaxID=3077236 RepID=UPI0028DE1157|nr:DinB family protein [Curvibacter sp. APW13]MDT8991045.1 DinB family protein [Curvibacter sp. APW13]
MGTLHSLFQFKAWANRALFARLQEVDADTHAEALHAMVRMLNHIYVVDRIFRAHLLGEPHGYTGTNTEDTPTLDELQFNVAETDAWYLDHAQQLSEGQLGDSLAFTFTDGDAGCMSREEMLLHVITHGSYHRGNVGQMLKGIGMAPPRDLYTKFLHEVEPQRRSTAAW